MDIRLKDLRVIERLWRELEAFQPGASDPALEHCFGELAQLIGAANVFWVGARREPPTGAAGRMRGWRVRAFRHLYREERQARLLAAAARHADSGQPDPHTEALIATAGHTRAFLRTELVADTAWRRCWTFNEVLRPLGITDQLVGAHTVDATHESYIGLDRARGRPFGERERDVLHLFLAGAPRFHREVLRSHGLAGDGAPLSPRERQTLELLLSELSEKQIAAALGIGGRTAHEYAVAVYRKLGVSGRTGLMASWLGRDRLSRSLAG